MQFPHLRKRKEAIKHTMGKEDLLTFHRKNWFHAAGIDFKDIEPHILNFQKVDEVIPQSPRFFILVNLHTYQYEFIGKGQYLLTGYDNELVKKLGIEFQTANMHPEDGEIIVKHVYPKFSEILAAHPAEERKNIILQSNYRFKYKDGHYVHLIEQNWVMKQDEKGNNQLMLTHVYQLPLNSSFKLSALIKKLLPNQTYEVLYSKEYPETEKEMHLSPREKEVIRLLSRGFDSKEIGNELHISYHTVRTHRKNILHKLDIKSTNELLVYGITNGIV